MPVNVSYPGVYIQEVPSGSRAIAGVPTSIAAFIGYTTRGPVSEPVQIFSYADFERQFGGFDADSDLSYAVNHFFLNGGGTAWIVRVAANAEAATVGLLDFDGNPSLTVEASSEGAWGNNLQITVDHDTSDPLNTFNLTIVEMGERNGNPVELRREVHRNLSMNDRAATYAVDTVNAASDLVELTDDSAGGGAGFARSRDIPQAVIDDLNADRRRMVVSVDGSLPTEITLFNEGDAPPATRAAIETRIVAQIGAMLPGVAAVSSAIEGDQIVITSGTSDRRSAVVFRNASQQNAAAHLGFGAANGGVEVSGAAELRPALPHTTIADFAALTAAIEANDELQFDLVDLTDPGTSLADVTAVFAAVPADEEEVRAAIEAAMQADAAPALAGATATIVNGALRIVPSAANPVTGILISDAVGDALASSGVDVLANVGFYQPGVGPTVGAQVSGITGADGDPPTLTAEIVGDRIQKTGIFALEDADIFNIMCLPGIQDEPALTAAVAYAEERRSMIIIDIDPNVDTLEEARTWIEGGPFPSNNAVAYFPRIRLADPLQQNRLRAFPNSGLMAGLWARTDNARGIWKAPAGIEAGLRGVQELDYALSDPENGVLNPLGLNCLRNFPVYGTVAWGARTLVGANARASEWKYIPVRRTALFIEESLYRGTQFAVFEPNDEPLWAEIRLSVGSFMNNLFRQGAFQGSTPQEAYFVRCDSTTTTQADIDLGILNVLVGFAPLKPAEFVIISLQQIAGQGQ